MLDFLLTSRASFAIAALWVLAAIANLVTGEYWVAWLELLLALHNVTDGMQTMMFEKGFYLKSADLLK
ncbi:hypothetical protein SEA_ANNADREAMY_224 [Streptomyces phage Annadreamy]|uniref:Uncharacterized protein n=2 Tax=Annadreamyvirus annadreamy TaxID=2846392 RepID=A0A345GTN6_9CAUD|nr:hypothetical protein HWB75_gp054 [Streptomyces phage Annadreamy]AXG66308.1 hypothetical protein SEA_ANNADREAMY_224 [Streptomyces phage Annadreamy]QGH79532.1 hypothetical protein SEA_LIMPID_231 [Streptomyces phage Limpid]